MSDQPMKHGYQHGPLGPDPIRYATYHYIVKRHNQVITVESPAGFFHCTRHMEGYRLIEVEAGVAIAGGDIEIGLSNETQAVNMLSSNAVVASGDTHTSESGGDGIAKTNDDAIVHHGDLLHINVLDSSGGAKGLELVLVFI